MEPTVEQSAERMRGRRLRVLRGAAAAAIAVLFAATSHTLSGGTAPPVWLVVAVTLLAVPVCVGFVGRRPRLPRLAVSVGAAQIGLHTAFAAVGGAAPVALRGGHDHLLRPAAAMSPLSGMPVDHAAATMTFGHVLAGFATLVVLAWGERLVGAIALGIRRLLRRALVAPRLGAVVRSLLLARLGGPAAAFLDCATPRGPPRCLTSALAA